LLRGIQRRCRRLVEKLELPDNFSAATFCESLAGQRSRPIVLMPLPVPTSPDLPTGMWLASQGTDYILYDSQTSRYHQEQIILHEIGHILFGHGAPDVEDRAVRCRNLAGLPRASYSTVEEQEAETLATMLLLRGRRAGDVSGGASGVLSDAVGFDPWC
jgi:hypothetical protein